MQFNPRQTAPPHQFRQPAIGISGTHSRQCCRRTSIVPVLSPLAVSCRLQVLAQYWQRLSQLFDVGESSPRHPDELGYLTSASDGFYSISAMAKCIFVADWRAASWCTTMHSTPTLSAHRRRLAWSPTAGPG